MTTETIKASLEGWSEEDVKWLSTLPDKFQPLAQRYGRRCFALTMQIGICSHALGILARQGRGNRAIGQAVSVLQARINELVEGLIPLAGLTPQQVKDCKRDIELIHDLSTVGGEQRSKGGIILNS